MSYLTNFHSQISGPTDAPKLVFLHGVMGFSANWRRIAAAFESNYQILVYDQRGHGRSFQPAVGYGAEDYAADLEKILDELKWSAVNLVGHSMGGRNALHFASTHPERVTRLVIEDIGPSMYPTGANFVLELLDAVPVPFASKREAKAWFDSTFIERFKNVRQVQGLAAYLYANISENQKKEAVWRFFEPGIRESIAQGRAAERWNEVESLSMPTLLIRGEHSRDLPREIYERMLSCNGNIQGVEIPQAGHWVHSDQPDLFIEALKGFLG